MQAVLASNYRPTAIFAAADGMVPRVYDVATTVGQNVPRDLSIVGYSDSQIASLLRPRLTTLRQDTYQIGRHAAGLLMKRLNGKASSAQPVSVRLPPTLVVRESTSPLATKQI